MTRKVFIEWRLSKLGTCCLILIIWQTYDQAFGSGVFGSIKANDMIFIVFISMAHYLIWLVLCLALSLPWLPRKDVIAVVYCVPAKTPALGVPLANAVFATLTPVQQAKIQIPIVVYQGLQYAFSSVLAVFFRKWVASEEKDEATATNSSSSGSLESELTAV